MRKEPRSSVLSPASSLISDGFNENFGEYNAEVKRYHSVERYTNDEESTGSSEENLSTNF